MIELCNGYYIEIDSMNFTLKKKYRGTKKSGEQADCEKVCGYFSTLDGAIEKFVKLNQIDLLPRTDMDLKRYLELLHEINKEAVRAIENATGYRTGGRN